jgi:hypothetical protein
MVATLQIKWEVFQKETKLVEDHTIVDYVNG